MNLIKNQIPIEKQLEAITCLFISDMKKILEPYNLKWPKNSDWDKIKLKKFFSFEKNELIKYLKKSSNLCNRHYLDAINKRTTGFFIKKQDNIYKTGLVNEDEILFYKDYDDLCEAVADYIMLEFGLICY